MRLSSIIWSSTLEDIRNWEWVDILITFSSDVFHKILTTSTKDLMHSMMIAVNTIV